jgi:hypothetical protein
LADLVKFMSNETKFYHWRFGPMTITEKVGNAITLEVDQPNGLVKTNLKGIPTRILDNCVGLYYFTEPRDVFKNPRANKENLHMYFRVDIDSCKQELVNIEEEIRNCTQKTAALLARQEEKNRLKEERLRKKLSLDQEINGLNQEINEIKNTQSPRDLKNNILVIPELVEESNHLSEEREQTCLEAKKIEQALTDIQNEIMQENTQKVDLIKRKSDLLFQLGFANDMEKPEYARSV